MTLPTFAVLAADLARKSCRDEFWSSELWSKLIRTMCKYVQNLNWTLSAYHDSQVPQSNRRMVTFAYWSYLGLLISLTWNAFAALMALCAINSSEGRLAGFLLAMIYWFAGVPGGWVLWWESHSTISLHCFTPSLLFSHYCFTLSFLYLILLFHTDSYLAKDKQYLYLETLQANQIVSFWLQ